MNMIAIFIEILICTALIIGFIKEKKIIEWEERIARTIKYKLRKKKVINRIRIKRLKKEIYISVLNMLDNIA